MFTALFVDNLDINILIVVDKSIYLLLFRNLFKKILGSCAHVFYSLQLTLRSDGLHYLSFACLYGPSRGRSARWLVLPFVSCQDWHSWLSAHCYLFLQGVSHHLRYFLSLDSQPCLIWTFNRGIRSDLEGPFLF